MGSSKMRWSAPCAMARAIRTRCFSPPESVLKLRSTRWSQPTRSMAPRTIARSVLVVAVEGPLVGGAPDHHHLEDGEVELDG